MIQAEQPEMIKIGTFVCFTSYDASWSECKLDKDVCWFGISYWVYDGCWMAGYSFGGIVCSCIIDGCKDPSWSSGILGLVGIFNWVDDLLSLRISLFDILLISLEL